MEQSPLLVGILVIFTTSCLFRVIRWGARIRRIGRSMSVVPVLLPDTSMARFLFPKKWQVFHLDWHHQGGRRIYQNLNSDILALVSLFGRDTIFVSDPYATWEMKVTGAQERFRYDPGPVSNVQSRLLHFDVACYIWTECCFCRRPAMENS